MGNLAKRLLTAAVLVPVLLAALYLDETGWAILMLAALASALALDEYLRMALPVTDTDALPGVRAVAVTMAVLLMVGSTRLGLQWLLPGLALAAIACGAVLLLRTRQLADAGRHMTVILAGLLYVGVLLSVLPLLTRSTYAPGAHWLTVTLCLAFFSDTVAYAFGRMFGRHKLYPAVSPNKTWEGSVGGLVGGVLATVGVGTSWLLPELPMHHAVVLGLFGSAAGQIGDLVESMIKRTYGVKDSGALLPGHGGMLDRVDALLFVAPVVFVYLFWTANA